MRVWRAGEGFRPGLGDPPPDGPPAETSGRASGRAPDGALYGGRLPAWIAHEAHAPLPVRHARLPVPHVRLTVPTPTRDVAHDAAPPEGTRLARRSARAADGVKRPAALAAKRQARSRVVMLGLVLVATMVVDPVLAHWAPSHAFVVASESMGHTIPKGSLVFARPAEVAQGDIIVYRSVLGAREVHRIVAVHDDGGQWTYTTQGDANRSPDSYVVRPGDILGKVSFHAPIVGWLWLVPSSAQLILFVLLVMVYLGVTGWEARAWIWKARHNALLGSGLVVVLATLLVQGVFAAVTGTPPKSTLTDNVATTPLPLAGGTVGSVSVASDQDSATGTLTAPKLWKERSLWGCSPTTTIPPTCTYTPTSLIYATTALSSPTNLVLVDTSTLDGTVEFYLEAVMSTDSGQTLSVRLWDTTAASAVSGSEITTTSTTATTVRSGSFTLSGSDEYQFQAKVTGGIASVVQSVKLLSAQQNPTKTATAIPIVWGSRTTSTSFVVPIGATKWLYEGSQLDGTVTAFFEMVADATATTTTSARLVDRTASTTLTTLTTTSATPTRVRSASISLTSGDEYEVEFDTNSVVGTANVYIARIILTQSGFSKTLRYEALSWTTTTSSTSFTSVGAGGRYNANTEWGGTSAIFEATLRDSTAGQTATAQLFDTSGGAAISGSSVSVTGATNSRQRATVTLPTTDPGTYVAQLKASANTAELRGAWLIVQQANGKQYDYVLKATNNVAGSCTWSFTAAHSSTTGLASITDAKFQLRGDGSTVQDQVLVASGAVTQTTGSSVSVAYGSGHIVQLIVSSRPGASGTISETLSLQGTCSGIHTVQTVTVTLQ